MMKKFYRTVQGPPIPNKLKDKGKRKYVEVYRNMTFTTPNPKNWDIL